MSGVVDVQCSGCLVWWMSGVLDVLFFRQCGVCLMWWMSSVVDVLFCPWCGGCLVWWMSVWWMSYNLSGPCISHQLCQYLCKFETIILCHCKTLVKCHKIMHDQRKLMPNSWRFWQSDIQIVHFFLQIKCSLVRCNAVKFGVTANANITAQLSTLCLPHPCLLISWILCLNLESQRRRHFHRTQVNLGSNLWVCL